jgi:outer membrane protein assembly factor BamD
MIVVESGRTGRGRALRLARLAIVGAALAGLAVALSGCSMIDEFNPFGAQKYKMIIEPDIPASQTYDQGLLKLANGSPADAAKKFADLAKQYPQSDWARKDLLMETFAEYEAGDYVTAVVSADHYIKLYPKSSDTDYVLYLKANSNYNQIPDIARDQETAAKALADFQALVKDYPKSEYIDDAKFKIQVTSDQLAGKEMSIGRFYLNRRNYTAAINRFRNVLQYYQTTRHSEEALYRLTEAYLGLGIKDEAQTAAAVLGHNFPDGQWYRDAYALLKGQDLEPEEHTDSWISKLYHVVVPS